VAPSRVAPLVLFVLVTGCGSDGQSGGGTGGAAGSAAGGSGGGAGSGASSGSGGSNGGSGGSNGGSGGAIECAGEPTHRGEATYYDFADGSGNCSFDATPNDLMVAAMNHTDYAESAACGSCAHVIGPNGAIDVRIVDQCPECPQGNLDLSPEAFAKIAEISQGRVAIEWQYAACGVDGPVRYRFKEGSNQWWTALQLRNHRNAIASLEYEKDGSYVAVNRESYNYFVEPNGMGPGPYKFRVTDVYGNVIEDTGIAHAEAQEVAGNAQFPACGGR
jgi:expansin